MKINAIIVLCVRSSLWKKSELCLMDSALCGQRPLISADHHKWSKTGEFQLWSGRVWWDGSRVVPGQQLHVFMHDLASPKIRELDLYLMWIQNPFYGLHMVLPVFVNMEMRTSQKFSRGIQRLWQRTANCALVTARVAGGTPGRQLHINMFVCMILAKTTRTEFIINVLMSDSFLWTY